MRRMRWISGLAVLALLAGGAVASGAIPAGDGSIYACYNNGDGTVRVKDDPAAACPKGFSPLNWSQRGPAGTTGERGERGPQGEPGPGSDGVNIVLARKTVSVPGATPAYRSECVRYVLGVCVEYENVYDHMEPGVSYGTANCPSGTQGMGDGSGNGQFGVNAQDQDRIGYSGWRVKFVNQSSSSSTGTVEVRCVKVAGVTTIDLD
jgi:hypothetical protein